MSNILVTNLADTGKFNHVHITKEIGWKFLVVINMLVLAKMYHFILEKYEESANFCLLPDRACIMTTNAFKSVSALLTR